jgi:hypothetical protein
LSKIAFCSTLYPAALPFLDGFVRSLLAARGDWSCRAVIAIDQVMQPRRLLHALADAMPISLVEVPAGTSPAGARRAMLQASADCGADILICIDADDELQSEAVAAHADALASASISYGDMEIEGAALTLFSGARVPSTVRGSSPLLRRNFMGFTNTALRRDVAARGAGALPDRVTAADWWLFTTLLDSGATAQRTSRPVTRYRQHELNLLGSAAAATATEIRRSCTIIRQHYAALPATTERQHADLGVARLVELLEVAPTCVEVAAADLSARPGVWYDDIGRLVDTLVAGRQS